MNFIAEGGFGKVYQGQSEQYGTIAVKRLNKGSWQGQHEFLMEIALLSTYKHENLVSLLGFCDQDDEKILVYKHESNGSLDKLLHSKDLSWIQRLRICLDAARGLKYLHDDVGPQHRVLHRDIKSSNILLDENWRAKISDFGLSKIGPANVPFTLLISKACGTIGYVDPQYVKTGVLSQKSDVFSFGVVLFEVLCGRLAGVQYKHEGQLLYKLVKNHYENGNLEVIIDPNLQEQINSSSLSSFSTIAYQCLMKRREDRPTMSQVVEQLQEALNYQLAAASGGHGAALQQGPSTSMDNIMTQYSGNCPKSRSSKQSVQDAASSISQSPENPPEYDLGSPDHILATANTGSTGNILACSKPVSHSRGGFLLDDLLNAKAEMLGKGTVGTTYKAYLDNGGPVIVKRLKNVCVSKVEFTKKIVNLGKLYHENLVPIKRYYYGMDERLLVFDFIPIGSLSSILHGRNMVERSSLTWEIRSIIALQIACGIEHLHSHNLCHGNIKSNNILLKNNFQASVSESGLIQLVSSSTPNLSGYRAPEVIDTQMASREADVYGFGILLLELITGKDPTVLLNDEGMDLSKWVQGVDESRWSSEVFDLNLLSDTENEEKIVRFLHVGIHCEIVRFLHVGIRCASHVPRRRSSMIEVVEQIKKICRD